MEYIAILTGGDSAEYEVSLLSAEMVLKNLDRVLYKGFIVHLSKNKFTVKIDDNSIPINNNNFSFIYKKKEIKFNKVFMALHGNPAENGKIQPYFDKLSIPYTACNAKVSSMTFNKYKCNSILKNLGFNCAKSYLYKKDTKLNIDFIIRQIQFPCFIKPNASGSSYGVSKVKKQDEIKDAIENALKYDKEIIIEEAISGTEVGSGVFFNGSEIISLPITEITSENEFFDFEAKYKGKSKEYTPARISQTITNKIKETSIQIYQKMNLNGICRIDYIITKKNIPYIIEINTIPGLTQESIIPQQINAASLKIKEVFTMCLLNTK